MNKLYINNERFSIRFCYVMQYYGIKTVGQASQFLNRLPTPTTKLSVNGIYHTEAVYLIR